MPIRATVWGENVHEQKNKAVAENYPKGMHGQIAALLSEDRNIVASAVTLQDPEHGMTEKKLGETDVLVWWGHAAHEQVADEIVERVAKRVWGGMGLIVLHSGHFSKIFKRLMGAPCALHWREAGERERLSGVVEAVHLPVQRQSVHVRSGDRGPDRGVREMLWGLTSRSWPGALACRRPR